DLSMRCPAEMPPCFMGDASRIGQVITNLLSNALKFTPQGHVTVCLACEEQGPAEARIRIVVEDTGIGVAEDKFSLIFEKFVQADGSITRRYGGTGLGLAISRQLVEGMGGTIGVESEVGKGSTF